MKAWIWNLLVSFSQTANALLGGNPDVTLSDRMGRASEAGTCRLCTVVCWLLGLIDRDHCRKVREPDEA